MGWPNAGDWEATLAQDIDAIAAAVMVAINQRIALGTAGISQVAWRISEDGSSTSTTPTAANIKGLDINGRGMKWNMEQIRTKLNGTMTGYSAVYSGLRGDFFLEGLPTSNDIEDFTAEIMGRSRSAGSTSPSGKPVRRG